MVREEGHWGPLNDELDLARRRLRWAVVRGIIAWPLAWCGGGVILGLTGYGLWYTYATPGYAVDDFLSNLLEVALQYWWWVCGTVVAIWIATKADETYSIERRFLRSHNEKVGTNVATVIGVIGGLVGIAAFVWDHWDKIIQALT